GHSLAALFLSFSPVPIFGACPKSPAPGNARSAANRRARDFGHSARSAAPTSISTVGSRATTRSQRSSRRKRNPRGPRPRRRRRAERDRRAETDRSSRGALLSILAASRQSPRLDSTGPSLYNAALPPGRLLARPAPRELDW